MVRREIKIKARNGMPWHVTILSGTQVPHH